MKNKSFLRKIKKDHTIKSQTVPALLNHARGSSEKFIKQKYPTSATKLQKYFDDPITLSLLRSSLNSKSSNSEVRSIANQSKIPKEEPARSILKMIANISDEDEKNNSKATFEMLLTTFQSDTSALNIQMPIDTFRETSDLLDRTTVMSRNLANFSAAINASSLGCWGFFTQPIKKFRHWTSQILLATLKEKQKLSRNAKNKLFTAEWERTIFKYYLYALNACERLDNEDESKESLVKVCDKLKIFYETLMTYEDRISGTLIEPMNQAIEELMELDASIRMKLK